MQHSREHFALTLRKTGFPRGRCLVDEIAVQVLAVLLRDDIRLAAPGLARMDLEPVSSTQADGVTILRFRVRKWRRLTWRATFTRPPTRSTGSTVPTR